ncbi:beta-1,3-galactosyl-O-glycosyl-glycoprotein beta-1,6-N-acetylglucosaminyltransferase 3-like [Microcaecilia unicolor]|uniref:Beta-1,3-galactosyl-O-glycosyl-glycoprotein beta-1,6-N-acetylglucosaminyltransferase 3 n=1 Tax=Microcaecilia unicolor TaxID=1415580 RepID=A0A6P7WYP1_9AMPH|nr:beta-1,3-galactosyl-O-glycosyl-glycoprotein beta-1,6-N-acetylglucosaminyltransferase 3-like [Microcaecilia unicolor]
MNMKFSTFALKMVFYKKRTIRWRHIRHLMAFGFLLLFAVKVLLTYVFQDCNLDDFLRETTYSRSNYCKDQLFPSLTLSPQGPISCSRIISGDQEAIERALLGRLEIKNKKLPLSENDYLNWTKHCNRFKETRKFIPILLSKEEANFPIAYSMVIHENIEMYERLLRAIYTPQNVYCVHVDEKSPEVFKEAVRAIASCFENVFVASKLEKVVYASWSRVQADLNCMEDLLKSAVPWRYLINTCGTDFPIKTNAEIVRGLKVLNGKNSLESEKPPTFKKGRWQFQHEIRGSVVVRTDIRKPSPPISVPIFVGNAYFVVTRDFVKSVFEHPDAEKLLQFANDTYSPDEFVWATLNRLPGIPGSVPYHGKYDTSDMNAMARLVKWDSLEGDTKKGASYPPCTGTHRHLACVYGTGDLHWMLQHHHLFANKFDPSVDDYAIQCLEEYLRHRTLYGEGL